MPTKHRKIPSYRLHKPTGQAVVRLDGRDHYLGKHGTEASQEAYRRKVAEWLTARPPDPGADTLPVAAARNVSVNDLVLAFWTRHALIHYRHADGTPTGEQHN